MSSFHPSILGQNTHPIYLKLTPPPTPQTLVNTMIITPISSANLLSTPLGRPCLNRLEWGQVPYHQDTLVCPRSDGMMIIQIRWTCVTPPEIRCIICSQSAPSTHKPLPRCVGAIDWFISLLCKPSVWREMIWFCYGLRPQGSIIVTIVLRNSIPWPVKMAKWKTL